MRVKCYDITLLTSIPIYPFLLVIILFTVNLVPKASLCDVRAASHISKCDHSHWEREGVQSVWKVLSIFNKPQFYFCQIHVNFLHFFKLIFFWPQRNLKNDSSINLHTFVLSWEPWVCFFGSNVSAKLKHGNSRWASCNSHTLEFFSK